MKTKKTNQQKPGWWATKAAQATGFRLYGNRWSSHLGDRAEMELDGRSHYYDEETRRYFGSRVLDLFESHAGLLLCSVESVQPPHGPRVYRAVIHDLLGNTLFRSFGNDNNTFGHARANQARTELERWLKAYHDERTEARRVIDAHKQQLRRALKEASAAKV